MTPTTPTDARRALSAADPVAAADAEAVADHPAFDQLFDRIVATGRRVPTGAPELPTGVPEVPVPPVRLGLAPARRHRRTVAALTAAAAAVALVAALSAALSAPAPARTLEQATTGSVPGRASTPWRGARPLPGATFTTPHGRSGSWQLVGDLTPGGWQLNTAGPVPGYLTCPTTSACYVTGNGATGDTGPSDFDSLYVSGDGGHSWSVLALPAGFTFNAPLTCAGPGTCLAAGTIAGGTVLIATTDGGHQWTVTPVAIPGGVLVALQCLAATACSGLVAPPSIAPVLEQGDPLAEVADVGETFVRTTDGGRTWTSSALPAPDRVTDMSCPTATACVAIGYPPSAPQDAGDPPPGFALRTTDGGATWTVGSLPAGFGFGYLSQLSCTDATDCTGLGSLTVPNTHECGVVPLDRVGGCMTGARAWQSAVVTTTDGGRAWRLRPFPADVPAPSLDALSCATATTCWVAGSEAVPQGNSGGSAVVLGTDDGGATWSKATFTVPSGAPEDVGDDEYMSVGQISCPPTGGGCVALGAVDQGSSSAPVYSDAGAS